MTVSMRFISHFLDMFWLAKNNDSDIVTTPFQIKIKQIVSQLMLDEFEIAYWHALNIAMPNIWTEKPTVIIQFLLSNALFVKMNCNEQS